MCELLIRCGAGWTPSGVRGSRRACETAADRLGLRRGEWIVEPLTEGGAR